MKQDKAMEWVAALRSGKYTQGRQALEKDGNFCCLGVACDLSGMAERVEKKSTSTNSNIKLVSYDDSYGVMPESVQKDFGAYRGGGRRRDGKDIIIEGKAYGSLWNANDYGCSFEQIADYIENNWEAL